jgi:single-strand DNA-binding protein
MAQDLNKVQIIGRLGADPEVRNTERSTVANLRVATSKKWTDKRSGEKKEQTQWHTVVVWANGDNTGQIDFIEQYVHKGDLIYVEGELQTRKWQDKDGADRYSTEIVVQGFGSTVSLLSSKDGGSKGDGDDRRSSKDEDAPRSRSRSRDDEDAPRSRTREREAPSRSRDEGRTRDQGAKPAERQSRYANDLDDDIPF